MHYGQAWRNHPQFKEIKYIFYFTQVLLDCAYILTKTGYPIYDRKRVRSKVVGFFFFLQGRQVNSGAFTCRSCV